MALDLNDKTSNGNTLTNDGGAEVTASLPFAQSTEAVDLEAGETDFLYADDSASLSPTAAMTVAMWVKLESTPSAGNNMVFASKYGDVGHRSFLFSLYNDSGTLKAYFAFSNDGTNVSANDEVYITWAPDTGTWYHVAVTFSGAAKEIKFYVDGAQVGSTKTTDTAAIYNSDHTFDIGVQDSGGTPASYFDGVIDDVRVYNSVITDFTDRSQQLTGSESGLVAYWPFEEIPRSGFFAIL